MAKKKNGKSKKIDPKVKATILSKLTLLGGFKDQVKIAPQYKLRLEEKKNNVAVISFGRMNPPTIGHQKLVDKVKETARSKSGKPMIFLSHTQDSKKNPLGYNDKIRLARTAFGRDVIKPSRSKTIIQIAQELEGKYDDLVMIVGDDRVREFTSLLNKYNGKDYSFNNIEVISAGTRDPDSSDVSGMSASKMRGFVSSGDEDSFRKGLPFALQRQSNRVFDLVSKNLNESFSKEYTKGATRSTLVGRNAGASLQKARSMSGALNAGTQHNPEKEVDKVTNSNELDYQAQNMALFVATTRANKNTIQKDPQSMTDQEYYEYMVKNSSQDVMTAARSLEGPIKSMLRDKERPKTATLNKDTGYRNA